MIPSITFGSTTFKDRNCVVDDVSTQRSVFKLWVWVLSRAGELFCSPHLFEACLRVDCDVFVLVMLVEDNEVVIFVGRGVDQR